MLETWRQRARRLKREVDVLGLAARDPRVPWTAKVVVAAVLAYAFSPIDLIPDFVPVLGLLDDLILVPLGIALALRLIPPDVLTDARDRVEQMAAQGKPISWVGAAFVVLIWIAIALAIAWTVWA